MRVLFLSRWFPYPPDNGSRLRIFNLLRGLTEQHEVTLLSFCDREVGGEETELTHLCRRIVTVPWRPYRAGSRTARFGLFLPTPRSLVDTHSPQMAQAIRQAQCETPFDLAIASEIDMVPYARYLRDVPALIDELQVGTLYQQYMQAPSRWRQIRHGLTWYKYQQYLERELRRFAGCTVVSERERYLLNEVMGLRIPATVIPNGVDITNYAPIQQARRPHALVFTGALTFWPNYEGVTWFLRKVYPQLLETEPEMNLTITGNHAGKALPRQPNVQLTGYVDDVRPVIAGAQLSLAPIFGGGGTRLKILEALALRTPVVSTTKGAEGLAVTHGRDILLADTPDEFAHAVLSLLRDPQARLNMAEEGFALVRQEYDWQRIIPRFLEVVQEAGRIHAPNGGRLTVPSRPN